MTRVVDRATTAALVAAGVAVTVQLVRDGRAVRQVLTWEEAVHLFDVPQETSWRGVFDATVCCGCGCTDDAACSTADGPCSWALPDLCSACVDAVSKPSPRPPVESTEAVEEREQPALTHPIEGDPRPAAVRSECCLACLHAIRRYPPIDADIIDEVQMMRPAGIGQRTALEQTLQTRRAQRWGQQP